MKLLPVAFSIFVVILAQSAATSRAYAARYQEHFSENMDLIGLGLANLGAGLSGAFVVNGSPTASEMVDSAGGRSQLAQISSSMVVLLVLLFLTGPLAYMPAAVLSAVVFLICVNLVDVQGMRRIYRERPAEFWVALITAATVVLVGVMQGIVLAMFLSLVSHTRHGYRPKNAVIVPAPPVGVKTQPVATQGQFLPGLLIYRFTHGMYYANTEVLSEEVTKLATGGQAAPGLVLHRRRRGGRRRFFGGRGLAHPLRPPARARHQAGIFRGLPRGLRPAGKLGAHRPGGPGRLL